MNRKRRLLCSLGLSILLLSGCGKDAVLDAENPVTIDVWTYYNGDQLTAFEGQIAEFNKTVGKEKGIIVKSNSQGSVNDLETNVLAAVNGEVGADEVPDIFAAYADTAYTVDELGGVVNLADYLTEEEIALYIDGYIAEGDFHSNGEIKIFPTAKSTEVLVLNKTDWDRFAEATGATYEDLKTVESLVETAGLYYEWTDAQTPDSSNDGKALFGRDAMANYMLIGGMQLGTEIFGVTDGRMVLNFDKNTVRKLWDAYYVPFVKGHFAATGRFRSDDIKTGNVIAYVGASSGASYFPENVNISDTESYPIEIEVLPCPKFEGGADYAVQQGAGMVVTKGSEAEIQASVEFLKWFTSDERNIAFSVASGYLPVTKSANNKEAILQSGVEMTVGMEKTLAVSIDTVNNLELYTTKAFATGTEARDILEYAMADRAVTDRKAVVAALAEGQSLDEAIALFVSNEYFDAWYEETRKQLEELEN